MEVDAFAHAYGRDYLDCRVCRLVFLAPEQRLHHAAERAHYDTHRNNPADPAYRAFLSRLVEPLASRLPEGARGLDFGSGPGPAIPIMMEEMGFPMVVFDPFFAPDEHPLLDRYDFITCSETAEHFFEPADEFARLDSLLVAGGYLAVMTSLVDDRRPFDRWRYSRDPTHVCLYRPHTMRWIATHFGWAVEFPRPDVVLFRKSP